MKFLVSRCWHCGVGNGCFSLTCNFEVSGTIYANGMLLCDRMFVFVHEMFVHEVFSAEG